MKCQWTSSTPEFPSVPAALIANIVSQTLRMKTASDTANIGGVPGPYLSCLSNQSSNPRFSKKLSSRPAAATPSTVPPHIASITDGFSFAYLKEAFVASLLTLVQDSAEDTRPAEEEDDREWGRFGNLLQKQIAALREDLAR